MGIVDRYVLRVFAKVLAVCFVSMVGLYLVIDVLGNLDEFLGCAKVKGGLLNVLAAYYAPRILTFFDLTSPLLAVISGVFTITWLQSSRELTALMASGIPPARTIAPLFYAAVLVTTCSAVNREVLIPQYQESLSRNAQNWLGESERPIHPCFDKQTGINLSGKAIVASEKRIVAPVFRLNSAANLGYKLEASEAFYRSPTQDHPAGYWLKQVTKPRDLDDRPSFFSNGQPVILTAQDTPWLPPGECFVSSRIPFSQLTGEQSASRFASTGSLISALRNPSLDTGTNVRVTVHSRFVKPLMDASLFLMGISLVLSRRQRNAFVAAGLCFLLVTVYYLITLACQSVGNHMLLSPAMAAWSPLFLFGPSALYMATPIWD
ncbi:MAG TPA: LptF/LptG family permease [Planctomycetes bacterium]|nr:LptF/LptG family permease [Planctomycetaceae bacterium]HIM31610.1 LptF/LptG family permease [Planctomycetota bacterium]